jgi:Pyruvate/2-oxoacid:ferredoxin oxidoreductase gamma subunit
MTMTDFSIILAGFGGQGILSAGRIIATAALLDNHESLGFHLMDLRCVVVPLIVV